MKTLFVMGIFRTGSSLLSAMLNVHPQIYIAWQPYLFFFKTLRNRFYSQLYGFDGIAPDLPMGILTINSPHEQQEFLTLFKNIILNDNDIKYMIEQIIKDLSLEPTLVNIGFKPLKLQHILSDIEAGSAGSVLYQLIKKLRQIGQTTKSDSISKNLAIVGSKEIFCEEFAGPLLNYDQLSSRIIHIIRDPRAVAASRNYGKYCRAAGGQYPLSLIVHHWIRGAHYYKKHKSNPRFFPITYERLVMEPRDTIQKLCGFMNVSYMEEMISPVNFKNNNGDQWRSNTSFEMNQNSVETSSLQRWKQVLRPEEIQYIEHYCGTHMESLGYSLENSSGTLKTPGPYQDKEKLIKPSLHRFCSFNGFQPGNNLLPSKPRNNA